MPDLGTMCALARVPAGPTNGFLGSTILGIPPPPPPPPSSPGGLIILPATVESIGCTETTP